MSKDTDTITPEPDSLRSHAWKRFIQGPDSELLEDLYVPALGRSVRYDRCCAYFSSGVLAAAARGFAGLIERLQSLGEKAPRPAIRLVVNEELPEDDVRALTETGDLSALEARLKRRFKNPKHLLEKQRLAMLAWLVKQQWLEVRVGVMRHGGAGRLKRCLEKLGGYPEWDLELCLDLEAFAQTLSDGRRRARLLGTEVDAALDDPRWSAQISLVGDAAGAAG